MTKLRPWRWPLRIAASAILINAAMLLLDERVYAHFVADGDNFDLFWRAITSLGLAIWTLVGATVIGFGAWVAQRGAHSHAYARGLVGVRDRAALLFAAVAGTGLTAAVFKQTLGRARPALHDKLGAFDFQLLAFSHKQASFPSGHTTTAFAAAAVIALLAPRFRLPALAVAAAVAASRLALHAHYVSDVAAGAALGWFGAVFIAERMTARGMIFNAAMRPREQIAVLAAFKRLARAAPRDTVRAVRRIARSYGAD